MPRIYAMPYTRPMLRLSIQWLETTPTGAPLRLLGLTQTWHIHPIICGLFSWLVHAKLPHSTFCHSKNNIFWMDPMKKSSSLSSGVENGDYYL